MQLYKTRQRRRARWTAGGARQHFAELLRAAARSPQEVYRRDKLVAAVIDPASYAAYEAWRSAQAERTIGSAFAELRLICAEEGVELAVAPRRDRSNDFAAGLSDEP